MLNILLIKNDGEWECKFLPCKCNQKPTERQFSLLHKLKWKVNGEKTKKKTSEQSRVRKGSPMEVVGFMVGRMFWKRYVLRLEWKRVEVMDGNMMMGEMGLADWDKKKSGKKNDQDEFDWMWQGVYFKDKEMHNEMIDQWFLKSIRRGWSRDGNSRWRMNEWMMFLLTCDKKLTKSQLSPTHASTKRKITDELKRNAGWYEVREGSPVEVQWAVGG